MYNITVMYMIKNLNKVNFMNIDTVQLKTTVKPRSPFKNLHTVALVKK